MFTTTFVNVYEPLSFFEKAVAIASLSADELPRVYRVGALVFHIGVCWMLYDCLVVLLNAWAGVLKSKVEVWSRCVPVLCAAGHTDTHTHTPFLPPSQSSTAWATRVHLASCLTALFFGVAPVNVEVMGWASAGPYAPSTFFMLACVRAYLHRSVQADPADAPPRVPVVSWCVLLYFLALMHKATAWPLPVALVAVDFAMRRRPGAGAVGATSPVQLAGFVKTSLARKAPLLLVMAAFAVPMFVGNDHDEGFASDIDVESLSLPQRLVLLCIRFWGFLACAVAPFGLRPHYRIVPGMLDLPFWPPMPPSALDAGATTDDMWRLVAPRPGNAWMPRAEPLLAVVATLALVAWLWSRRDAAAHVVGAVGFYAIMLAPMSGIVQHGMVQLLGDRYAYVPLLGVMPLAAAALAHAMAPSPPPPRLVKSATSDTAAPAPAPTPAPACRGRWAAGAAVAWIAALVWLCGAQIAVWRSCETLWTHALRVDSTDWRIQGVMAEYRNSQGRPAAFRYHMSMELEYSPPATLGVKPALSRGRAYFLVGENAQACKLFEWALRRYDAGEFYSNVGVCALQAGQPDRARALFRKAADLLPSRDAVVHNVDAMRDYDATGLFHGAFVY